MSASDTPQIGQADTGSYYWWYDDASSAARDARAIRMALRADLRQEQTPDGPVLFASEPDAPWEAALTDPAFEARVLAAVQHAGPGWAMTQSVHTAVAVHLNKKEPLKAIALIERVVEPAKILRSPLAHPYVRAVYEAKDASRLDAFLEAAANVGTDLENDLDTARLLMLRRTGKAQEADALESKLLARCVANPPLRAQPDPLLLERAAVDPRRPWLNAQDEEDENPYERDQYRRGYSRGGSAGSPRIVAAASLSAYADQLGVRFDQPVTEKDVTVRELREAYERHALWADAARLVERELVEASVPAAKRELLLTKARLLHEAGRADDAKAVIREAEAAVQAEIQASPRASRPRWALVNVFMSKAAGPDYAKAYEALTAARAIDPAGDAERTREVRCLYKLGRHREAWDAFRAALLDGRSRVLDDMSTLYPAAIAGCRAGEPEATALARMALFRFPQSPLADEAREVLK